MWVEAWHEYLADIDATDAMAAVRAHYSSTSRMIGPADILSLVETLAGRVSKVDPRLEQEADWLGIPTDELVERLDSDPGYIAELAIRARARAAIDE